MTGYKRNRRFLYRDYLHLFNDEQDLEPEPGQAKD